MKRITKTVAAFLAFAVAFTSLAHADGKSQRTALLSLDALPPMIAPLILGLDATMDVCLKIEQEKVDRGHFAYVVSATQKLNMENEKYYATLTLINETGLFTVDTVDDVENYNFFPVLTTERVGKITELEGKFIRFDMRETNKIQKLEPRRSAVSASFSTKDGFYLVNVVDERGGVLSFYDTASEVIVAQTPVKSLSYHSDGHAVISISGDSYEGSFLRKISARTEALPQGLGNAVIQVLEGEIVRVFSFDDGYEI